MRLVMAGLAAVLQLCAMDPAWEHFYNLEYDEALQAFQKEIAHNPDAPSAYNHVAHAVLYREMFRAGALESELVSGSNPFLRREKLATSSEASKQFDTAVSKAMTLCQARIAKDPNDRDALLAYGVSYALRSNYNFLVRKAWLDALKDATQARKLHNRVVELDPANVDARLLQGLHDYIVGSLPWHWKMLGFVAGFRGDRASGIRTLHLVAAKGKQNHYDAQFMLAAIYRRERRPLDALPLVRRLSERFPRNYLLRLEMVQMYSDAGDKDAALKVLEAVESDKRAGHYATLPIEKVYFYRGVLLFWYNEPSAAVEQFRRVTPRAHALDLHTAVTSWLRLGQALDMQGKRSEAVQSYRNAISAAPESDAAKESRQYLSSPYKRT